MKVHSARQVGETHAGQYGKRSGSGPQVQDLRCRISGCSGSQVQDLRFRISVTTFPRGSAVSTRSSKASCVSILARKFPCSVTLRGSWRASQCKKSYWRPSKVCKGQRRNNSSWCGKFPGSDTRLEGSVDFSVRKAPMASLYLREGPRHDHLLVQQLLVTKQTKL